MRYKRQVLFFILFLSCSVIYPQQQFLDYPFGGGGGFTPGWIFSNPKSLNTAINLAGMPVISEKGIFTTGGSGFLYIGFIPNLRLGGMGYGGSSKSTSGPDYLNFSREAELSIGAGGFTVEYTIPFIRDVGVSVGAIIGGGSMEINLYKNRGTGNWGSAFTGFTNTAFRYEDEHVELKNNFWILTPTLNIEIPVYRRFVALRIGAGYQFTLGEQWEYANGVELQNAPSDLNGRSFFIQAGIYAGFFSF